MTDSRTRDCRTQKGNESENNGELEDTKTKGTAVEELENIMDGDRRKQISKELTGRGGHH